MFNILNTGMLKLNLRIICSKTDPKNIWEWDRGKLMDALFLHIQCIDISCLYSLNTIISLWPIIITVETVSLIVLPVLNLLFI